MARRKSLIKIPFFKVKINSKTIFNILGFVGVAASFLLFLSFVHFIQTEETGGALLSQINKTLVSNFGGISIFIPFIVLLVSAHFFNSKKLKFIKPNITIGLIILFLSSLPLFQSGSIGKGFFEELKLNITGFGSVVVLFIFCIIGIVLILDTSIDVFFVTLFNILRWFAGIIKKVFTHSSPSLNVNKGKQSFEFMKDNSFIQDKKIKTQKPALVMPSQQTIKSVSEGNMATSLNQDIVIKPLNPATSSTWIFPPLNLLIDLKQKEADRGDVKGSASIIENTLESFGISARVGEVNYGPAVTQYALEIARGTKLSKITALGNDLALALAAPTGAVRIEAPIPGRSLVGIEIPNKKPEIVTLRRLLAEPLFSKSNDPLLVPLGLDVSGQPQATSISKMPHCLIAGTTGSGKSVILNAWITTFLFRTKPEDLRMILVDPKRVELTTYNGIPHLLTEVIVEQEKTLKALRWTVSEMENRYKEFAKVGARNLEGFNQTPNVIKKPYILFIIDELADLMIFAPGDVENLITRIAQMARATGIHLILATQRPSVDVITGLMKANIPTRVAFNVSSMIDSRVIIDMPGAEKLLGKGDMLFLPPDQAKPRRIQGPFLTEKEVGQVVRFLQTQVPEVHYTEEITEAEDNTLNVGSMGITGGDSERDPYFNQVVSLISQIDRASASLLQRKFKIGYSRAARLLDELEAAGFVGPAEGSKPREVLKRPIQQDSMPLDTTS